MELAMQQEKAKQLRADIIKMLYLCQSGHPGGSLSLVEMLMAIYYNTAHVDPKNPKWEDRDRIVLSKGHGCPAQYAILAEDLGLLPPGGSVDPAQAAQPPAGPSRLQQDAGH